MGFRITLTSSTRGIRPSVPARWRAFEDMCAIYWQAVGDKGAEGYYLSPDPRLMLFFENVSDRIAISDRDCGDAAQWRPMLSALFIPSGVPIWTRFLQDLRFSHLDLHFRRDWLEAQLERSLGAETASAALRRRHEVQDGGALALVARALVAELDTPSSAPQFAESLALSLMTGLVSRAEPAAQAVTSSGGLAPAQMRRLRAMVAAAGGRRLTNAEFSAGLGLSEGWFCHAFKRTTGQTPLRWQQEQRLALVKQSLVTGELSIAEIAAQFGFSDQAHLTRVFRQSEGVPPATWRRELGLS